MATTLLVGSPTKMGQRRGSSLGAAAAAAAGSEKDDRNKNNDNNNNENENDVDDNNHRIRHKGHLDLGHHNHHHDDDDDDDDVRRRCHSRRHTTTATTATTTATTATTQSSSSNNATFIDLTGPNVAGNNKNNNNKKNGTSSLSSLSTTNLDSHRKPAPPPPPPPPPPSAGAAAAAAVVASSSFLKQPPPAAPSFFLKKPPPPPVNGPCNQNRSSNNSSSNDNSSNGNKNVNKNDNDSFVLGMDSFSSSSSDVEEIDTLGSTAAAAAAGAAAAAAAAGRRQSRKRPAPTSSGSGGAGGGGAGGGAVAVAVAAEGAGKAQGGGGPPPPKKDDDRNGTYVYEISDDDEDDDDDNDDDVVVVCESDAFRPSWWDRAQQRQVEADFRLAERLHEEEERRRASKRGKTEEEEHRRMMTTTTGRALKLVESVLLHVPTLYGHDDNNNNHHHDHHHATTTATLPPSTVLLAPVARDDMVTMAERLLELQATWMMDDNNDTNNDTNNNTVDIGFHYTRSDKLKTIRTDGLLSRRERTEMKIGQTTGGEEFGNGVYTSNNPFAFTHFGDVGLIVARLKGRCSTREQTVAMKGHSYGGSWGAAAAVTTTTATTTTGGTNETIENNSFHTIIGNKMGSATHADPHGLYDEVVLKTSAQVIPLVQYNVSMVGGGTTSPFALPLRRMAPPPAAGGGAAAGAVDDTEVERNVKLLYDTAERVQRIVDEFCNLQQSTPTVVNRMTLGEYETAAAARSPSLVSTTTAGRTNAAAAVAAASAASTAASLQRNASSLAQQNIMAQNVLAKNVSAQNMMTQNMIAAATGGATTSPLFAFGGGGSATAASAVFGGGVSFGVPATGALAGGASGAFGTMFHPSGGFGAPAAGAAVGGGGGGVSGAVGTMFHPSGGMTNRRSSSSRRRGSPTSFSFAAASAASLGTAAARGAAHAATTNAGVTSGNPTTMASATTAAALPPVSWQTEKDYETRKGIMKQIRKLLKKEPFMTADPPTVKQLEERLYLTAKSLFEYADPSTLAKRVREAAGAMKLNSPSLQPLPKPRVVPPRTITYAAPKSFQKASAKNLLPVAEEDLKKADDDCVICIEPLIVETTSPVGNCGKTLSRDERRLKKRDKLVKLPCGHMFHRGCILDCMEKHGNRCPMKCTKSIAAPQGKCPTGSMTVTHNPNVHCSGFESCGTITIQYQIPRTTQLAYHQNPGKKHSGAYRTCYLPDNPQGNELLLRLEYAFLHGLTFMVGTSMTTGLSDQVTWTSIHHKTQLNGGSIAHGFPDPSYFQNCNSELDQLGVPAATDLDSKQSG